MIQRFLVAAIAVFGLFGCDREAPEPSKSKSILDPQETVASTAKPKVPIQDDRPETIAWGPKDPSGLQLGVCLSEDQTRVNAVVRNAGEIPVRYCDHNVGYYLAKTVKARRTDKEPWQKLPIGDWVIRYLDGVGPRESDVHVLEPGQEMPPERIGLVSPDRTFDVYLLNYEWPDSWSGSVSVVVGQPFISDREKSVWTGTLESAPIKVDVSELKAKQSVSRDSQD